MRMRIGAPGRASSSWPSRQTGEAYSRREPMVAASFYFKNRRLVAHLAQWASLATAGAASGLSQSGKSL
jgi:hypothetical protein